MLIGYICGAYTCANCKKKLLPIIYNGKLYYFERWMDQRMGVSRAQKKQQ